MGSLWAFVKLSRPHFLLGGTLLFVLGSAAAGDIAWPAYALGQAMVTSMQITAHFVNEYADRDVDRAVDRRTMFSGGSGVLVSGDLKPEVALRAAWASTTIGVILAAVVAVAPTAPRCAMSKIAQLVTLFVRARPVVEAIVQLDVTSNGDACTLV